jgi:hypothetical protein
VLLRTIPEFFNEIVRERTGPKVGFRRPALTSRS